MQVCISLQTDNHASTPQINDSVFTGRMPFLPPNQQHQRKDNNEIHTKGYKLNVELSELLTLGFRRSLCNSV